MDFQALRTFVLVVECGNFTKAAEALLTTQPNVSLQVKQLETMLDTKLLDRSPKHVRLTGSGKILYDRARQLLALYNKTLEDIHDYHHKVYGSLTIAASYTIGEYLLPQMLPEFHEAFPDIEISVHIDNTEHVSQNVHLLKADLGLIEGTIEEKDLLIKPFMRDKMLLVASPDHPAAIRPSLEALQGATWVGREKGSGTREFMMHFLSNYGIRVKHQMIISSNQGIKEAVIRGLGLTVLSELVVKKALESGELVYLPFPDEIRTRVLSYILPTGHDHSKTSNAFLQFLQDWR